MKDGLKYICGLGCFPILRQMERTLPVQRLYSVLQPFAFARAVFNTAFKNSRSRMPLPACLKVVRTGRSARQERMKTYLNHFTGRFQDRLAEDKWMSNCHIKGLEHIRQARQNGCPVVLAFCHFGPYYLLRFWLRAAAIPVATVVGGKSKSRPRLSRFEDHFSPFQTIPAAFHLDQLRAMVGFLAAGNLLLIAIDGKAGSRVNVPFCDGWNFQMATGAVRLAIRHQAELIPCSIIDEGRWRFRIELGRPVPREFLTPEADGLCAGKFLLNEMLPHFQAHPEQCSNDLIRRLKQTSSTVATRNT
jgi:hypothetical protein